MGLEGKKKERKEKERKKAANKYVCERRGISTSRELGSLAPRKLGDNATGGSEKLSLLTAHRVRT